MSIYLDRYLHGVKKAEEAVKPEETKENIEEGKHDGEDAYDRFHEKIGVHAAASDDHIYRAGDALEKFASAAKEHGFKYDKKAHNEILDHLTKAQELIDEHHRSTAENMPGKFFHNVKHVKLGR